jgi:hypothetical protein
MEHDSLEPRLGSPEAKLEQAFIDEYLRERGVTHEQLRGMPDPEAKALLKQASTYAASKLAEVESRAHYVHEIHEEH